MPATVDEMLFNRKHTQTYSVIEQTFGILKMRFRSWGTLQYSPQKVAAFFVACCVLHNISMNHGCVDGINEEILEVLRRREVELHVPMPLNPNAPAAARERRAHLAEELHRLNWGKQSNLSLMLDYIAKITPCIHNLVVQWQWGQNIGKCLVISLFT